jgi:hypothetical protein
MDNGVLISSSVSFFFHGIGGRKIDFPSRYNCDLSNKVFEQVHFLRAVI